MNRVVLKLIGTIVLAVSCIACNQGRTEDVDATTQKRKYEEPLNLVETVILKKTSFHKEIVSNGKLTALRKSELKFKVGGELKQLNIKNGQLVNAGQNLAYLDQFEFRQRLEQAETAVKKAEIDLQDELLSYGGLRLNSDSIPPHIYEGAAIRSGYVSAERDLKTARFNLESTVLRTPFKGKVANIMHNSYEQITPGEVFCTIIDDTEFEVVFHLIESEIREVALDNKVRIIPFAIPTVYQGIITEINPLVEENGLVEVRAKVRNNGPLLEGMNVKVLIEKEVEDQLVVPKSAVVLRQNQEVLFKYVNGRTFWTYIQIGLENSTSYSVIAHPDKAGTLQHGDTIIISDNLNLAHESKVEIKR